MALLDCDGRPLRRVIGFLFELRPVEIAAARGDLVDLVGSLSFDPKEDEAECETD